MSGLTSCEEGVIEAVDQSLSKSGKNTSSIIPVKMIANNDEFWHLLEFVDRKIKDVSEQIRNGNVDIAPYPPIDSHDVCKYCKYKDICRFEAGRFGTDWNNMEQPSNDDLNRELYGRI